MSNEFLQSFNPSQGFAENLGLPSGTAKNPFSQLRNCGLGAGSVMPPGQVSSILFLGRVPNTVTLATGLTINLMIADDPLNHPGGGGLVVQLGVTAAPITSGTTTFDETVFGSSTEVTSNVTMPSTPGAIKAVDIALPIADMNSLAAGGYYMLRVRRIGTATADTDTNSVLHLNTDVRNT